ncbi:MAG TPA: hypothetical protein DHV59_01590 [Oxalobacteraceae bacterium]|nr:hypothetical protein [Oxalobacteraceae bacterium]
MVAEPSKQALVPQDNQVSNALGRLGATGMQIADQMLQEKRQEQEDMARAKGANAALDHEIFVKNTTQDISDRVARGELPYKDAQDELRKALGSQKLPAIEGLHPAYLESLDRGFKRQAAAAEFTIGKVVEGAQRAEFKGQFGATLDKLGKLAGMPGADVDKIIQQADLIIPLAKKAAIPDDVLGKTLQDWKDKTWTNHATQRAMQAKDDLAGLQKLEHDLTAADGYYSQRLDTDKRNTILRGVINDRIRIENRAQADIDRREAKAEKVIGQMDAQIASGIPMTPDMALTWLAKVKGTAYEADFQQRIQEEDQVQKVLRLPIDQQKTFLQQKEAALLTNGGTPRDKANLARLKTVIESNTQQLQNAPLLFVQNRTGQPVAPLDLRTLLDPNAAGGLSSQMSERVATISAMRKEYGPQVKMNPLLPQEAKALVSLLDEASPKQQAMLFSTLRGAFNDDSAYTAAVMQIAPDSPVKAVAGVLTAARHSITLESKWYGTDSVAASTDVAETLLLGESMVNKTAGQKAQDGSGKSLFLPPRAAFNNQFATTVGDAYRGRIKAQEVDLQLAYAYYVGRAAQTGRLVASEKDVDAALLKESIAATIGELVDFNEKGKVTAPLGITKDRFEKKIADAFVQAVKDNGLPESLAYQFDNYGLAHYHGSTYVPTLGGKPVLNPKTLAPLVLDIGDGLLNPGLKVPK